AGLGGDGRIVAAAAGVVGPFDFVPGAIVAPGTALVTVSSAGGLEARLGVEAADAGAVAAGEPVQLVSANRPDLGPVTGRVRSVAGAIDPVSGNTEVRVAFPAAAPLESGEHVRAAIEVEAKADALVVPRNALLPDGDKWELFTIAGGKAVHHEVERGIVADDWVEVIAPDLHAGDAVVTLGNYELEDGMIVQPPEPPAKPDDAKAAAKPAAEAKP
ncbi:MAG: efflux RND transporter periplasmic adaptor subunit, partial [Opitutales bacterium]